jgi:hypothetical protein
MNTVLDLLVLVLLLGAGLVAGGRALSRRRSVREARPDPVRRILLPFTGQAISRRSFEAAVRLAKAENAVIMPAFLATVPRQLPLDAALPLGCGRGMPLLEAIEQKAACLGVRVDARVSRGRSYRDALRRLLETESFDRVIVPATNEGRPDLGAGDVRWLLERAPAEVLILRPAPDDHREISGAALAGHF